MKSEGIRNTAIIITVTHTQRNAPIGSSEVGSVSDISLTVILHTTYLLIETEQNGQITASPSRRAATFFRVRGLPHIGQSHALSLSLRSSIAGSIIA